MFVSVEPHCFQSRRNQHFGTGKLAGDIDDGLWICCWKIIHLLDNEVTTFPFGSKQEDMICLASPDLPSCIDIRSETSIPQGAYEVQETGIVK
jgi:hypothetical protein